MPHDASLIDFLYLQHPELIRLCRAIECYCRAHNIPRNALIHGVAWDFHAAKADVPADAVASTWVDLHGQPAFNQPYEG